MRARDYHMWWMASRIGLGHPLESDNYAEIVDKLSPAGVAVVIAIHMIPSQFACDKDYMISKEKAERMQRWSAALRQLGAERLAAFVESSVGVDHLTRASESSPPEEAAQLMSKGVNIFEAWKTTARRYYDQFDIETHSELEACADRFAKEHAKTLAGDIDRYGDNRPTSKAKQRSFQDDWLEAVTAKHDSLRDDEHSTKREADAKGWEQDRQHAEKLLGQSAADERQVKELVGRLSQAYRELVHIDASQLGPVAGDLKSKLATLINQYREWFPDDVRPDAAELRHQRVVDQLQPMLNKEDIAWLAKLGHLARAKSEMYDPVVFSFPGDVDQKQRTLYVDFASLEGLDWNWATPYVSLMLGPVGTPAEIDDTTRAIVTELVERGAELGRQLAAELLSDFRERFLPMLSTGPMKLYQPDVSDQEVLADVESASITIQWNPTIHDTPRIVCNFGVVWDDEHGVCLEESTPGTFGLSEL